MLWTTCATAAKIQLALSDLPKDLEETYARCLQRLDESQKEYSLRVLRYVYGAKSPLTIEALGGALATKPDTGELDKDDIPSRRFIMQSGANLVTFDEVDGLVTPAHHSVRTFLNVSQADILRELKLAIWFHAEEDLGHICVVHLLWHNSGAMGEETKELVTSPRDTEVRLPAISQMRSWIPTYHRTIQRFANATLLRQSTKPRPVAMSKTTLLKLLTNRDGSPFYTYARNNWLSLNRNFSSKTEGWTEFEQLVLADPRNSPERVKRKHKSVDFRIFPWNFDNPEPLSSKILGWAICNGHLPLLELALSLEPKLNMPLIDYGGLIPLHLATKQGNVKAFREIQSIQRIRSEMTLGPLEVNPVTGRTSLHYAAETGSLEIIDLLLHSNMESNLEAVEISDRESCNPLQLAIRSGSLKTVRKLEEKCGCMLWTLDRTMDNLLRSLFAGDSTPEIASHLLEKMKQEHPYGIDSLVLTWAIKKNAIDLIPSLVEAGISLDLDLDSKDLIDDLCSYRHPAIFFAIDKSTPAMAATFIDNGANSNVELRSNKAIGYSRVECIPLYPVDLILSRGWVSLASNICPRVSEYLSSDETQFDLEVKSEDVIWFSILVEDWIITRVMCDSHTRCSFAAQLDTHQRFVFAGNLDTDRSHCLKFTMVRLSTVKSNLQFSFMMGTKETSFYDWRCVRRDAARHRHASLWFSSPVYVRSARYEIGLDFNQNAYNKQIVDISDWGHPMSYDTLRNGRKR